MARCRIWCLSGLDGLPFLYASRQTAFMSIGSKCIRLKPETGLHINYAAGYSTTSSCVCKNIDEKYLNMSSVMRKVFSNMAVDKTICKNKMLVPTCRYACGYEKSGNIYMNQILGRRHFSVYTAACKENQDYNKANNSDAEDRHIKPALDSVIPSIPPPNFVNIVPGKGPPPEPPIDCCMSGCANCVWIQYAEELKKYYCLDEGNERAKTAIEQIENPGLKMFLKLELGLL